MWHLGEANRNRYLEHKFAVINYIGFHDRGMLFASGCGGSYRGTEETESYEIRKAGLKGETWLILGDDTDEETAF